MIDPIDEEERQKLLRELLLERDGLQPRYGEADTPQAIARRRRVLCALDDPEEQA